MDSPDIQTAPESKLHFLDYWRIIRIRKVIIISVFLITTIIAAAVSFIMHPLYSSTTQIKIEPDIVSDVQTLDGSQTVAPYDPYFMETELQVIQGEVVLSRVIDNLNLNAEWSKKYGQPLKTTDTLEYLRHQISLDADRNTKLINITVYDDDKDEAASIANAIVTAYRNYRLELHAQQASGGIKVLDENYQAEQAEIQLMQSNVDKLRDQLGIYDTDPSSVTPTPTLTSQELQHYNELLIEGQAQYMKQDNQLTELKALSTEKLRDVLPTINPDTALSALLGTLHDAEQNFVKLTNDDSMANPDVTRVQSLIGELNHQIDDRVNGIMVGLESNVKSEKAALDALNAQVQDAKAKDQSEATKGQPYWEAKRQLEDKLELHKLLAAKIDEDKMDLAIPRTSLVTITDPATPGKFPVRPNKTLNILLGMALGLIVGVGLAFFIEYLDTSVKTIDEVERVFQVPVLGVIPQNVGSLMDEGPENPHAEAYRVLRTNILFSRKDDNLHSIVVVSAGAGEGKSTTTINLATVFAQAGERTLVVDSDLRRPTLHKLLHVANNMGLTNYLLKQNTLDEVIQTTTVPMLDFMASGKLPSSSMNILSSAQMKNLISELKQRYDFVIFDSPPIMGVSDASVLASEMDMAVQVIQYRRYPQLMNIRAKQLVEKVGGNLLGIVLNNISMAQDESYYYYGGYYQSYYSRNNDDSPEAAAEKNASGGDTDRIGIKQKY